MAEQTVSSLNYLLLEAAGKIRVHSQEDSLSFSPRFVNFGLANQKLCYIQMLLSLEKFGE